MFKNRLTSHFGSGWKSSAPSNPTRQLYFNTATCSSINTHTDFYTPVFSNLTKGTNIEPLQSDGNPVSTFADGTGKDDPERTGREAMFLAGVFDATYGGTFHKDNIGSVSTAISTGVLSATPGTEAWKAGALHNYTIGDLEDWVGKMSVDTRRDLILRYHEKRGVGIPEEAKGVWEGYGKSLAETSNITKAALGTSAIALAALFGTASYLYFSSQGSSTGTEY